MIKTILFIIVIAIIAYFIYHSFNESKLKGGDPGISDEKIWEIVDHVIKHGDYGSKYIPTNYKVFSPDYKKYLMFEYAKGINAYHKKYEYIIKFDEVEKVYYDNDNKEIESYKYTTNNNNVELIISASEKDDGNIESCYKLIVKCNDFTDTDSNGLYRQAPNDVYSLNSSQNEIYDAHEARTRVGPEGLNDLNLNTSTDSIIGNRIGKDFNEVLGNLSDSDNNDGSTIKQPIIEPVATANENTNINNDDKENTQEAENNNQTTNKDETNIEQEVEKKRDLTDIDNQEAETTNLNNQNTEQTDDIKKELIALFKQAVDYIETNRGKKVYYLTPVKLDYYNFNGNPGLIDHLINDDDFVRNTFNKINTNKKYKIEYSENDGWTIHKNED